MARSMPQFVSLTPIVLSTDRVLLNLETTNFESPSNVFLEFDSGSDASSSELVAGLDPTKEQTRLDIEEAIQNSPYPNVELSILDPDGNQVAQLFIVEHKEAQVSMTMHLRQPRVGEVYTAKADMIHARTLLQTLTTPFELQSQNSEAT